MSSVSDATTRIRRRRRRSRVRTVLRGLVVGVVVAVLGAGVWLVGFSPVLAVEQVTVTGLSVLDRAEVEKVAAIPYGTPMARLDAARIERRIAALAPVREVRLERSWPTTVTIEVTERTPLYAVKQNQGDGYLLVDAEGVAYTAQAKAPPGLLVASADSADLLPEIARVVAELPESLRKQVRSVKATTQDSIQLSLTKGRTVVWGSAERSEFKATVLLALLDQKGTVYDVSAPDWPSVR